MVASSMKFLNLAWLIILVLGDAAQSANVPYYPGAVDPAPVYGQLGCCRSNYPGTSEFD